MKSSLFTFLIIVHLFALGQSVDTIPKNANGMYEYTEVVKVDSASADKLYSNAKLFIVDAFKSGKDVTQLNDDNTKTIAASGNDKIVTKGYIGSAIDKRVRFRILIQCKDGRYKYTINNFEASFFSDMVNKTVPLEEEKKFKNKLLTKKQTVEFYQSLNNDMSALIIDLKKHMASHAESTQNF